MRNLKRALSFALAAIMLVGLMVVGAGAAYKDFTDADEIQHEEAVKTLTTLNVIAGKEDGSYYDPNGTLTRAEMAKLIVYVLHGGKEPVLGTKAQPTYSDIDGHWAEAYIEYCSSVNIIAGDGAGRFNPENTLTASQAAKMLLVAMNYDAKVFGFTGNGWEINVNREANSAGLYDELDGTLPSNPISRDDAAQMVYNAILAKTMKLTWGQNMETGEVTQNYTLTGNSLFTDKFDGIAYEGVLVATGKYGLATNPVSTTGSGKTFTASKDRISIAATKVNQNDLPYTTTASSGSVTIDLGNAYTFKYTEDLSDLMGQSVKVLYNSSKNEVYGVYPVAANNTIVLATTTDKVKDIKSDSLKANDVVYDTDSLKVFVDGATGSTADLANTVSNYVTFIDNDDDDKIELAIVNKVGAYEVTYTGTTSFTTKFLAGEDIATSSSQKFADVTSYEGMAKDDIVLVSKDLFAGKDKIVKAEVAEGTISGRRNTVAPYEYLIDGNWYKDPAVAKIAGNTNTNYSNGDVIKYVALGNLLYYTKLSSGAQSISDVVMLVSASAPGALDQGKAKGILLSSDGSSKTVSIKAAAGSAFVDSAAINAIASGNNCGKLYTYSVDNDGVYTLTLATDGQKMGSYTWVVGNATVSGVDTASGIKQIGGVDIADDAVIFLFNRSTSTGVAADTSNDAKVITGKDLKSMGANVISATANFYGTATTNGLNRVAFAAVVTAGDKADLDNIVTTSSANYGYVVAAPYTTKIDGVNYVVYPIWDGSSTVNYNCKAEAVVTGVAKGSVIGYDVVDSQTIKSVTLINAVTTAVTGLDGSEFQIESAGSLTYKVDGDTKYLYVNSNAETSDGIGQEGGAMQVASQPADGIYVKNVMVYGTPSDVKLVVVDTENKMVTPAAARYDITVSNSGSKDVKIVLDDVQYTATTTDVVEAGDVLKITNNETGNITLTITGVDGTVSGVTVAAGSTVTYIATGAADLSITIS